LWSKSGKFYATKLLHDVSVASEIFIEEIAILDTPNAAGLAVQDSDT
jgi:hypothetical protein